MNRRKEALRRLGQAPSATWVYSWTRPWMFKLARKILPGFQFGFLHVMPGDHFLILTLYGPRFQHFRKDHGRPGEIWNPRRWGGAILGVEIGCRG